MKKKEKFENIKITNLTGGIRNIDIGSSGDIKKNLNKRIEKIKFQVKR